MATIRTKANLRAVGIAGSAGFVVYDLTSNSVVVTRAASVSGGTIAAIGSGETVYTGTFSGTYGVPYLVAWDDGAGNRAYDEITPAVNLVAYTGLPARLGDGVASAIDATHVTLDATDANFARNNVGSTVRLLTAVAGAGQHGVVTASDTSTGQQTIGAGWSDAATVTGPASYEVDLPANATVSDKTGYTLTSAYDAAKVAAPASTALSTAVWTNAKAAFVDAAISGVSTGGVSASAIATAVWQDVLSGSDFGTTGSAGKLLKDNITAPLATASALSALTTAVGTPAQASALSTLTTTVGAAGAGLTALAPASTALSSAVWTGTKAGFLDAAVSAAGGTNFATSGLIEPGETGIQSLRMIRAEAVGAWNQTTHAGATTFMRKDGTTEAFHSPNPTSAGRGNSVNGGGL